MAHDHAASPGGHAHGATERRLRLVLVANVAVVAVEAVAAAASGSLALLADAGHNLGDVTAIALALGAHRLARRAPTGARSFGWHRGRVLVAQANAAALLVVTGVLLVAAVQRLADPRPVSGGVVLVVATVAALVNGGAALSLRHERDLGARGALLHLASDALASVGVAVSGAIVAAGGWPGVDPLASAAVSLLVLAGAWRLLRQATGVLLEGTPHDIDPADVTAAIEGVPGVASSHDLHVWSLDGRLHAMSVHVVLPGSPSLDEAQRIGTAVKRAVSAPFSIAHATVELESEGCADDGEWCAFER